MTRAARLREQGLEEDFSIIAERRRNYRELLGPPPIEIPARNSNQKAESSGLPDGSYEEGAQAPLGESIDKAAYRLSKAAAEAWKEWCEYEEDRGPCLDEEASLTVSIEEAMLSAEETLDLLRLERLLKAESIRYERKQKQYASRLITETVGLANGIDTEIQNRYFISRTETTDEFGSRIVTEEKIDRCDGKPVVTKSEGVVVPNMTQSTFSESPRERLEKADMTRYQTEVWRDTNKSEEEDYLPNIGPEDDPDYIAPSDISSRNFVVYPPASRAYNCVFKVITTKGDEHTKEVSKKVYPSRDGKDYTSITSIKYMLDQKGYKYEGVVIDTVTGKSGSYLACKFETDLRVTYGENCVPDPKEYKNVDPDSNLGQKMLQLLNEQPHIFEEFSWMNEDEDGEYKVLAVGLPIRHSRDNIGPRVYWVYVKPHAIGVPRHLKGSTAVGERGKKSATWVAPQINYKPLKVYRKDDPNYKKKERKFLATVRVSDDYYYFLKEEGRWVSFSEVQATFNKRLEEEGYQLCKIVSDTDNHTILNYQYVHTDSLTALQRKTILQNLLNIRNQND